MKHETPLIFVLAVLFSGILHSAPSDLVVEFDFQGKHHKIQGEQLPGDSFIFNKNAPKKVRLATLDWAPYIGKDICKQGWVQQVTVAILASLDYEITSDFRPWARAVTMVESGESDILYPEYLIDSTAPSEPFPGTKRLDHLVESEPFPGGPIAFLKRKGDASPDVVKYESATGKSPVERLNLLKGAKIGVVRGYQNTPEFDALKDKKFFNTQEADNDLNNAKKLVNKRINLIIGDPAVIRFTVHTASALSESQRAEILSALETVQPVIQYNHLYYAISKKKPQLKAEIDKRLSEFMASGDLIKLITQVNDACHLKMDDTIAPYLKK